MLYMVPEIHKGYLIEQRIKLGVPGVIYTLLTSALTSAGNTYERTTRIAVLPNLDTAYPVFIPYYVTSQPYPINATETVQSPSIVSIFGKLNYQPSLGPDIIRGSFVVSNFDLYGSGTSYAIPFDAAQGAIAVSEIDIYGSGTSYSIPFDSITGDTAVLDIFLYGAGVSYSIDPDNIRGTVSVTSIEITT
jgi:hypothetical protein